jgi:dihydroorotase
MTVTDQTFTFRRPDDWHLHLRDGAMLESVVGYTARQFARAVIMPNLSPPVTTMAAAAAYADRIRQATPPGLDFTPLMTAYLTDASDIAELKRGFEAGVWVAAKLYPAKATTNSDHGVTDIQRIMPTLEGMARIGMPMLVHGEVVDPDVDVFDREAVFIDRILEPLIARVPELKIVFEHITTADATAFVEVGPPTLAATVTAHHLVINRNAMFEGGIRPHFYCLPVAKRERHRLALRRAVVGGSPKFFLGTDSAPHLASAKESSCGCAGLFTAPVALEAYLQVFDEEGALDRFESFASLNGPAFYGLPVNAAMTTARRGRFPVPPTISLGAQHLVPFLAGGTRAWTILDETIHG